MVEQLITWIVENFAISVILFFGIIRLIILEIKYNNLIAEMRKKYSYWILIAAKSQTNFSPQILSDIQTLIKKYER